MHRILGRQKILETTDGIADRTQVCIEYWTDRKYWKQQMV
jgi:hypothetical protein